MTGPITTRQVDYDRRGIRRGIMCFGTGDFHRGHPAMFIDRLMRAGNLDWGITAVGLREEDRQAREEYWQQDGEYTLVERGAAGPPSVTRVGSVVDYLYAPDEAISVIDRLANPTTKIVTLAIADAGRAAPGSAGGLSAVGTAVFDDIANPRYPSTALGLIVAGLRRRRAAGTPPFTILSLDDVARNGAATRRAFVEYARTVDTDLAAWIATDVAFPDCVIDQATPPPEKERRKLRKAFGIHDAHAAMSEPHPMWVLEDVFRLGRPPLDDVGVLLVNDVAPYREMKSRLLDGARLGLAYTGLLSGFAHTDKAMGDPQLAALVTRYLDREAAGTIAGVPRPDVSHYQASVLERLRNPLMRESLAQVVVDGSERMRASLVSVAVERSERGLRSPTVARVIAAWARFAEGALVEGRYELRDRQSHTLRDALDRQAHHEAGFLEDPELFGSLAGDARFSADFGDAFHAIDQRVRAA